MVTAKKMLRSFKWLCCLLCLVSIWGSSSDTSCETLITMNTKSYQRSALADCLHVEALTADDVMNSCGAWQASVENINHVGDHAFDSYSGFHGLFSETDSFFAFHSGQGLNTVDKHIPRVSLKWHGIDHFDIFFRNLMTVCSDWNMKDMMVFGKGIFYDSKPVVSEPVSMLLMGAGMLGLSVFYRRKVVNS